jgi:hypothetical protein
MRRAAVSVPGVRFYVAAWAAIGLAVQTARCQEPGGITRRVWVDENNRNVFAVFETAQSARLYLAIESDTIIATSQLVSTGAPWELYQKQLTRHLWRTTRPVAPNERYFVRIQGWWSSRKGKGKKAPDWFANVPQCDLDTEETDESTEESPGLVIPKKTKPGSGWRTVRILAGPTGEGVNSTVELDLPSGKNRIIAEVDGAERTGTVRIKPERTKSFRVRSANRETGSERITLRYEADGYYLDDVLAVTVVGDRLQIVPAIDEACLHQSATVWAYRGTRTVKADWYVGFTGSGRIEVKKNKKWVAPKNGARILVGKKSMQLRGSELSKKHDDVKIEARERGDTASEALTVVRVEFVALEFFDEGPVTLLKKSVPSFTVALVSAGPGADDPGIAFAGVAKIPTACKGTLQFVQNVASTREIEFDDGSILRVTTRGQYYLDRKDPYDEGKVPLPDKKEQFFILSADTPTQGILLKIREEGEEVDAERFHERVTIEERFRLYLLFKPKEGNRMTLGLGTWSWTARVEKGADGRLRIAAGSSVPQAADGAASDETPRLEPNITAVEWEVVKPGRADTFRKWYELMRRISAEGETP